MIALGGTIGTGLFVSSGQTLARGGPAFILGSYLILFFFVFCVVTAIVEVGVPTHTSLGWRWFYSLGILVPYEISAAGLVIDYWHADVNIAVWVSIMIVVIVGLNWLPVQFDGETELWYLMVSRFARGPNHDRLGFRYWKHPGAANTYLAEGNTGRFLALLLTLVLPAFPFTFAPEFMIATAGEMRSPRRNLPIAARRYIYRLFFFYLRSVFAIGVTCPSNDPAITSGGSGAGASAFVVAIKNAGIPILDSVINAGIIISAWSSGNLFLYLSSRSWYSLALSGNAPSFFKACTKEGVPLRAVACSFLFCTLGHLNCANSAVKVQGITDLPYHSFPQLWGTWAAMNWSASSFLTAYIGKSYLYGYLGHRICAREDPWAHPSQLVDLSTGMDRVLVEEKPAKTRKMNWWLYPTKIWS
ncbi:hypothetical protein EJ08DRAFT_668930 [Tothia fuscella]|uniref:Amino acid permease/ SLC12A domain-containing protein n=1 Tax=Tothia fuscella TaxID=1048955 RepID=A0A9P4NX89_9PEZI|nr:hypothetical protein EJ08DRAFT_668930 [Tothia fuscella]